MEIYSLGICYAKVARVRNLLYTLPTLRPSFFCLLESPVSCCLPRASAGRSGWSAGVEVVGDVDDAADAATGEGGEGGAGVQQRRRRGGLEGKTNSGILR